MKRNILGVEKNIRYYKDEQLHIFDAKGDELHMMQGKGAGVDHDGWKIPANTIMTHNHPRALAEKGIKRIGNSFSIEDITTAVRFNAKEIRAVTPTYTFSMKRPAGGWGVSPREVEKEYKRLKRKQSKKSDKYEASKGYSKTSGDRTYVTYFHQIMKGLSGKFGLDYTKKNS